MNLYLVSFSKNLAKMSVMFRDRPIGALNTAIYWIEYAIRNGPDTLKSFAIDTLWWQLKLNRRLRTLNNQLCSRYHFHIDSC